MDGTPQAVRVRMQISSVLCNYAQCPAEIALVTTTVASALEQLERCHASLYRSICDETGSVRRHVNLFLNSSNIRDLEALDTKLQPGDVIIVLPAVSGGTGCRNA